MSITADGPVGQTPLWFPLPTYREVGVTGPWGSRSWGFWTLVGEQLWERPAVFAVWVFPGLPLQNTEIIGQVTLYPGNLISEIT